MKVPFANLQRDEKETQIEGENIEERIKRNILDVIKRKNFILGDYVERFEKAFADYCGVKHFIGIANGLSALELSLIGLNIWAGDEVITVANTFNATVAAIVKIGVAPVLVDASEEDFNLEFHQVLNSLTNKTKAIIPVHLYGQTASMDNFLRLAQQYRIPIIEDVCQAHGSYLNGKRAGSFGAAGCFSFYPGKNLGCYGDGGAIVTNDGELANFLKATRNYGQTKKYFHDIRPDNSRLDTIQAAVLIEKLRVLDSWNTMRADNAQIYRKLLQDVPEIQLPKERKRGEHIYHLFVVRAERRDELVEFLKEKEIDLGLHYPVPIHLQGCFSFLNYRRGDFPVSERLSEEILTLPMFPTIRPEEIGYVTKSIKEFYSRKAS